MNEDQLYEDIHDDLFMYMMNELTAQYRNTFIDTSIDQDELEILADWLTDRATKFADDRAPEIFTERRGEHG